jgi:hypothetical protein
MALDFGLLQPINIGGQIQAGQDAAARNQLAQQQLKTGAMQQETSQLQLDQLKRDRDALAKMQQAFVANGKSPDLESNFNEMINSGIAHYVDIGVKGKQKILEQRQFANIMGMGEPPPARAVEPAPAASSNRVNEFGAAPGVEVFKVNEQPAPINALAPSAPAAPAAPVNALATPPVGPDVTSMRRKRDMLLAMGTTQSIAAARAMDADIALASRVPAMHSVAPGNVVLDANGKPIFTAPERQDTDLMRNFNAAKAQGFVGNIFDYERKIKEAGRTPPTPAQPSAPVAVVDPVTGKQVLVSREEALRGRMTPAAAMESLNPKEIQKREALLPQATQSLKTVNNTMSIIGQTVDKLLANPNGINGITGLIGGVTPALTDAARAAKADLEQLKNLAFVQGLTELRAASKTGAGVGNVSNREGDRFENLKASLDRSQSKEDLVASLRKLKAQADFTAQTMQEAYDSTYSYKSSGGAVAPAFSTGVDASNPLIKK